MPQRTLARRGSVWLCPSGIREDFINIRQPVDDCLHIFVPAKPFADVVLQDLDIDPARVTLRYEAVGYDPFIEQIGLAISRELTAETSAGRLLMESLSQSLSAYLVHHYSEIALRSKPLGYSGNPMNDRRLSRVMEFIDAHIEQNFTVADLAAVACMSPAHFARSFKATTGRSPHQFVSRMRLELATRMLADRPVHVGHRRVDRVLLAIELLASFSRCHGHDPGRVPGEPNLIANGHLLKIATRA